MSSSSSGYYRVRSMFIEAKISICCSVSSSRKRRRRRRRRRVNVVIMICALNRSMSIHSAHYHHWNLFVFFLMKRRRCVWVVYVEQVSNDLNKYNASNYVERRSKRRKEISCWYQCFSWRKRETGNCLHIH